jgi:c-di-GMP-binding flagellar brake protein YcgR
MQAMAAQPTLQPTAPVNTRISARWKVDMRVIWVEGVGSTVRGAMGRSIDISESGIGAIFPVKLALNQISQLEFTLPGSKRPIRAQVRLRRANGFNYGFEFVTLSQKQREEIRRACETLAVLQPA